MNPILAREMRLRLAWATAFWLIFGLNLILALILLWFYSEISVAPFP
jgi:hypothetical protein